ncbi:dipeptide ABC transporter ATP-binding protein [Candidatus Liberibacter americanus]|uniref:Dipeptide transport ATP-binding protein DppF n=1 Tax=Candidatus Liberibacter americanus str. Sao Paulo TaxID=1261131 RepID=U6B4Y6_9HYPH|nr:dipeptide ABC transporter ATP-binding protein [Candidatus Liberibacter americanus]AHA28134.1 Dipeptide transport ATP-binding protein DppF [Candidatus Liberibacter americanus str. Sao Paulo]EMS36019.1 dipeptide transporter ATP-binding subunit [Candidatus Liberibacter americanus PW_SP]
MNECNDKSTSPLLKAVDLKKYYTVKSGIFSSAKVVKALDGISLEVYKGKTLAIVGESGCGKSTLGRILTMIDTATSGDINYHDQDHLIFNKDKNVKKLWRQKIQIIFQNYYASLNPRKRICQILEEPLLINTQLSNIERREKILNIMKKVGLSEEHLYRYPHVFSGGQRQRIAIARGLILEPNILIADEPVSALDVSVQAQVLNLMMDLQKDFALSYVFISHDLSVVEHIADYVMVMYSGRCIERGTTEKIFKDPSSDYTKSLLSAIPRLNHNLSR